MKLLPLLLFALAGTAHAESFFNAEVGLGAQTSHDMGDGIWYQQGVPHSEQMVTPSFLAGVTGPVLARAPFDLRYHLDYVYFGTMSASCLCVPDANYNPHTHAANVAGYIPFSGGGHTQGLALTLEAGYTWHGYRLSAEAGPWLYWATWHETQLAPNPQLDALSHRTAAQFGWVAGAGVERGPFGLHYRYYTASPLWNSQPGMVTGTHMLYASYRF